MSGAIQQRLVAVDQEREVRESARGDEILLQAREKVPLPILGGVDEENYLVFKAGVLRHESNNLFRLGSTAHPCD